MKDTFVEWKHLLWNQK